MLEIPESTVIGRQVDAMLHGKIVKKVFNASSPHGFAWYNGNAENYPPLLEGRQIESANGHGSFVSIHFDNDTHLAVSDGVNLKYYPSFEKHPKKHQLLIVFDDNDFLALTVSMYGFILAFKGEYNNAYYQGSLNKLSPLDDNFDEQYFESIFRSTTKNISIKALIGTEQRIPGLGNGVMQDIFFNARIHPKRKISTLSDLEKSDLLHCITTTVRSMTDKGGRDTERDFYGNKGCYQTLLSRNTYKDPCPICGDNIVKEAFLGGAIYYCPSCQPL